MDEAGVSLRQVAFVSVVLVLAAISGPAIVLNTFAIEPAGSAEATVTVEDYAVTYDEDVEHELVSIAPVDAFGDESAVEASGVIVWSEQRYLWADTVSAESLAFSGEASVELGGPGWRNSVAVERAGWDVVGNDTAYHVWLQPEGDERTLAYASDPFRSDTVIEGNTITVVPDDGDFSLEVSDGSQSETVAVPSDGESVEANGVTIDREGSVLYAMAEGSRAMVASEEEYH